MASDKKASLHPAFAVSNIKILIPINLDIKQDEYSSWVSLFQLHLQAHNLMFLIDNSTTTPDLDPATILPLDALCCQWMFSTMNKDLMLNILKTGKKTAEELWTHLKNLFQDNKGSRAASLESKFVNLRFVDCNNIDDYCDKLQALSHRLRDLEFPMDDKRLVIQLVNGLPEEYNTVASLIQKSMPSFDTARSQLRTEEIRREQQSQANPHTALVAANHHRPPSNSSRQHNSFPSGSDAHRSSSRTDAQQRFLNAPLLPTPAGPRPHQSDHYSRNDNYWAYPPSLYPSSPHWASPSYHPGRSPQHFPGRGRGRQPAGRGRGRGTSSFHSLHAYITPTTEYLQPSDIAEAYSSLSIRQPDDDFYMDTGATSHITSDPGNLHNCFPSSIVRSILVGNGSSIPVTACGSKFINLPSHTLHLKDTLVVPSIIKNLISVRKFTTDNHVSIEFDPYGFSAKDLNSRKTILRCDSSGELYPITISAVQSSLSSPSH
ncbi:hypothetical protein C5167_007978 [Papaver somniferum]|uniref:Retrovirus-related Pol polyprotein from transposon TNT 1-94-like beta-barrel domain-containing protein n=1 Tax=Papaver somniferum TaxID=3469 RepID=A0A4Y7JT64_PAPSO|nr:hypothetical protein C5167_007978 [Papaver somniferum]